MFITFLQKTGRLRFSLLFCFVSTVVFAQVDSLERHTVIAVGLSANAYKGDLEPSYRQFSPAFHVSFIPNAQKKVQGSFHAGMGSVEGQSTPHNTFDISNETSANQYFRTRFFSLHYALRYHIWFRESFQVYISQGLGFMRFTPEDEQGNHLQDNLDSRAMNESYGNVAAILPSQLGLTYYFPNRFGVGVSAGWLHPTTDYLDNVSQLGSKQGNDKILQYGFCLYIPTH